MPLPTAYFWSKAPFVRLLTALVVGIILQWQFHLSFEFLCTSLSIALVLSVAYFFISVKLKYRFSYLNGIAIYLMIAAFGGTLVWVNDIRNNKAWIGNNYADSNHVVVTFAEPLVEKTKSFKALATVNGIYSKNKFIEAEGKLILYFKKDSSLNQLLYGSQIVFNKPLQEIKKSGNPGKYVRCW